MDLITYALCKKLAGGGGGRTDIFYFCTPSEVDSDGKPKISSPDLQKIYFTPNGKDTPNQYAEWVYKNGTLLIYPYWNLNFKGIGVPEGAG